MILHILQFLISTFAAKNYAEQRFYHHHVDFKDLMKIAEKILNGEAPTGEDLEFVNECKKRDNVFQEIKLDWFIEE